MAQKGGSNHLLRKICTGNLLQKGGGGGGGGVQTAWAPPLDLPMLHVLLLELYLVIQCPESYSGWSTAIH